MVYGYPTLKQVRSGWCNIGIKSDVSEPLKINQYKVLKYTNIRKTCRNMDVIRLKLGFE